MIEIQKQGGPNVQILIISGKLEPDDAEVFQAELMELTSREKAAIVLDMVGLNHICSTALGILISQHRRMRRLEGELKLVVEEGYVRNLLRMTMLDRVFPMFTSREDAVRTFAAI